ncbi:O-antigen ligase family protein [Flavobacteriaceae bacterium]|nr:O-antigen ligase family protein [Flavobacteriaceae bacterium]MDC1543868.1 O-antigen ligase family protein [Flavobacteriaceae bacterium]
MLKLFKEDYISKIIILLFLLSYAWPNFTSIDRIGNQWLYLSVVNLISIVYVYIKYQGNFSFNLIKKSKTLKWYFIFLMSCLLSIVYAKNLPEALITFNHILNVFVSFFLTVYLLNKINNASNFIVMLFLFALIVEVFFSFIPIIMDLEKGQLTFRSQVYSGLAANINITSFSIVFKLPFLLYFLFNSTSSIKKIFISILLIMLFFTISVLGTRGAYMAVFSTLIFTIYYILKNRKDFKRIRISALALFLAISLSFVFNVITTRKYNSENVLSRASTISLSTKDGSVNQRLRYYKQGVSQFISNPLVGLGIGNYKFKSIEMDKKDIKGYIVPYHAHNDFIQIAVEQGVLGLVSYIMIFITFIFSMIKQRLFRSRDLNIFLLASFSIFLIDSMFNFPIARPISQIQFVLLLSLVSFEQIKLKNEK